MAVESRERFRGFYRIRVRLHRNNTLPIGPNARCRQSAPAHIGKSTDALVKAIIATGYGAELPLPDRSAFEELRLQCLRDDMVIVYLNGTRVFADNLPTNVAADAVVYATKARDAVEPNDYLVTLKKVFWIITSVFYLP